MPQDPKTGKRTRRRARAELERSAKVDDAIRKLGGDPSLPLPPVEAYPPAGEAGDESERLLKPTFRGKGGALLQGAPLMPGEVKELSVVMALGLDKPEAEGRLARMRHYLLSKPGFEEALWDAMAMLAFRGVRHAWEAISCLLYGWNNNDDMAKRLGASLDEARDALKTVSDTRTMILEDLIENGIRFFRMVRRLKPELWPEVYRRLGQEDDRASEG
jgi:hypothetical protein